MLDDLKVDLTVVLGKTRLPIHTLLRMGRGAVFALEAGDGETVDILANGHAIARAALVVTGEAVAVEIVEMIRRPEFVRLPGYSIGASSPAAPELV